MHSTGKAPQLEEHSGETLVQARSASGWGPTRGTSSSMPPPEGG